MKGKRRYCVIRTTTSMGGGAVSDGCVAGPMRKGAAKCVAKAMARDWDTYKASIDAEYPDNNLGDETYSVERMLPEYWA